MDVIKLLAQHLKDSLRAELVAAGHKATGELTDSIDVTVEMSVRGFEIVGSALFYARFVESGRKPGKKGIPIDVLVAWIQQRKITIEGASEKSAAYMIQRSIKKKGIEPFPFIGRTLDVSADRIDDDITQVASRQVDIIIEDMFNSLAA